MLGALLQIEEDGGQLIFSTSDLFFVVIYPQKEMSSKPVSCFGQYLPFQLPKLQVRFNGGFFLFVQPSRSGWVEECSYLRWPVTSQWAAVHRLRSREYLIDVIVWLSFSSNVDGILWWYVTNVLLNKRKSLSSRGKFNRLLQFSLKVFMRFFTTWDRLDCLIHFTSSIVFVWIRNYLSK